MGTTLNRHAYQRMIDEDLAWLNKQPRTLEREHIKDIVRLSPDREYGTAAPSLPVGEGGELASCPWCKAAPQVDEEDGCADVAHSATCFIRLFEPARVITPDAFEQWNTRTLAPVGQAPTKDLRIYDRNNVVVTQGALNAMMSKMDGLEEDVELAHEDSDRLRTELHGVYGQMLRDGTVSPPTSEARVLR